jgi:outer membrane protein with beta-barrel domain
MRNPLLIAFGLVISAAPAAAQRGGTVELGLVGKWTHLDKSFHASSAWGAGVRLGLFLNRHWELELDDAQTFSHATNYFKGYARTTLNYYPHHLRIDFNQSLGPTGRVTWMIGAGPAYNGYGKEGGTEPGFKGHDWGIAGLTGFRARLSPALAFRADAIVDYIPSPNSGKPEVVGQFQGINAASPPDKNLNIGVQAGLSVLLGKK